MTLFELVKQNICVPDAAEHYELQVNRNGMCRCPFHVVATKSMTLRGPPFSPQHEAERVIFLLLRLRGHRRCDRPCGEVI